MCANISNNIAPHFCCFFVDVASSRYLFIWILLLLLITRGERGGAIVCFDLEFVIVLLFLHHVLDFRFYCEEEQLSYFSLITLLDIRWLLIGWGNCVTFSDWLVEVKDLFFVFSDDLLLSFLIWLHCESLCKGWCRFCWSIFMLVCGYQAHTVLPDLARLQHYLTTYPNNNSICESWKALVDNYSRSLKLVVAKFTY